MKKQENNTLKILSLFENTVIKKNLQEKVNSIYNTTINSFTKKKKFKFSPSFSYILNFYANTIYRYKARLYNISLKKKDININVNKKKLKKKKILTLTLIKKD